MTKSLRFTSLICAVLLIFSLLLPASTVAVLAESGETTEIVVLHTNDIHGNVDVEPYVASKKKSYEAEGKNTLLLSGGDALHGLPIATLSRGQTIVNIMNATGYDAMATGNHDYDYGFDRLKQLISGTDHDVTKFNFPVLAANVEYKDESATGDPLEKYLIKTYGDVKVGIFGLATPETFEKTNPANVTALNFLPPVATAESMVTELKAEGCKVIIALVHLGIDTATKPEEQSYAVAKVPGIDLVVDGHSHSYLESGKTPEGGGALVVQAGGSGEYIGDVKLTYNKTTDKTTASATTHKIDLKAPAWTADETVLTAVNKAKNDIKAITDQVIGTTPILLDGKREHVRSGETNLANMLTNAMLYKATEADVAITNGGGIRDSIKPGNITMGDAVKVLPYGNLIVTLKATGAEIKAAIENGIKPYPELSGAFPQIAGFRYEFNPADNKVTKMWLTKPDAEPVLMEDATEYTVATNDFMLNGGDGYTMFKKAEYTAYGSLLEGLTDYLNNGNPTISETPEGRMSPSTVFIESISIDKPANIVAGEKANLVYKFTPENVTNKRVEFNSSNTSVATVDANGVVTAVAPGTADIKVSYAIDPNNYNATTTVTVAEKPAPVIPVESVTLNKKALTLDVGKTEKLVATVNENATDKTVKWSTSNNAVATVDSNGNVSAIGAGTANITVTTNDGNKTDVCVVTVLPLPEKAKSISFSNAGYVLAKKGRSAKLTVKFNPTNTSDKTLDWKSSAPKIVSVDKNGKITAKANKGKAVITATTKDGSAKKATITVYIGKKVTSVKLSKTKATLKVKKSLSLTTTITPKDAVNKKLVWSSSNTKIAKVSRSGKITALKPGKAIITAKTTDGSGKKAVCTITVKK